MRSYYLGYDLIFSHDDYGWYAQDFNDPKQPVSRVYSSLDELKSAIRTGTISFK